MKKKELKEQLQCLQDRYHDVCVELEGLYGLIETHGNKRLRAEADKLFDELNPPRQDWEP